jgi:hypothetical protein
MRRKMSLLTSLFPDADPPATVENASVSLEVLPAAETMTAAAVDEAIPDLKAYDVAITESLRRGADRLAEAQADPA